MQNKGVGIAYLHNAKLVGNCRKLQLETLVTDIRYADDMALLAASWIDLEAMLTILSTHCSAFGLSVSCSKTKTMEVLLTSYCAQPVPIHLFPNDPPVEPVSSFQYLGSVIQEDCGSDLEVSSRICKVSQVFGSLSCILLYQKQIRTQTKLRIFSLSSSPHCSMVQNMLCCCSCISIACKATSCTVCVSSWVSLSGI